MPFEQLPPQQAALLVQASLSAAQAVMPHVP
jgi:hypothetical protein